MSRFTTHEDVPGTGGADGHADVFSAGVGDIARRGALSGPRRSSFRIVLR